MTKGLTGQERARARHCVEVLRAAATDARTSGWYRGEVAGKEAIGRATEWLLHKGLLQTAVGPQPFRLTARGTAFIASQIKTWETFMPTLQRPGVLAKVFTALEAVSEEERARSNRLPPKPIAAQKGHRKKDR
jgi:predicted DNA-binding transcriptional regulator AlpA